MSWEFGIILTDTPSPEGFFDELERTETDEFAGEWIDWDAGIDGYSGWNIYTAGQIGAVTEDANYALLPDGGNQTYVRLSERTEELERFASRLDAIPAEGVRVKCAALVEGCREALRRDPDRAVLLAF